MEVIHLHGQWQWHDEAAIVGNVGGLKLLRDAIDRAINNGGDGVGIFTSDGEGYHLLVIVSDDIDKVVHALPRQHH